jgi:hypothetical protein
VAAENRTAIIGFIATVVALLAFLRLRPDRG